SKRDWSSDVCSSDLNVYLAELETVRAQGYGVDDQENQLAGRCVAVPLSGLPVPAAISVSAPAGRLPARAVRHVAQQLRRAAEENVRAPREGHRSGHPPASSPRPPRVLPAPRPLPG